MSRLPRKRIRRYAVSPLGPPPDPSPFADPAHGEHLRAVAARVGHLLDRSAECHEATRVIVISDDATRYAFGDTGPTWAAGVYTNEGVPRPLGTIDSGISSDPAVYVQLGVETMARGIVAAVKRFERERDERPDRIIGVDTRGTDIYESDLDAVIENGRPAFSGEPGPIAEDLAQADGEFARKYGPEPARPIRDARGLLIHIGDALAALGLEPDLGGDTLTFLFLGHVHRLELEDLELRRPGPTSDELSMLAAGLAVG